MPQFDITVFSSQIFWLAICFGILYFVSAKLTLPKLVKVFERRWAMIQGTREDAEKISTKAEALTEAYNADLESAKKAAYQQISAANRESATLISQQKHVHLQETKMKLRNAEVMMSEKKASTMGDMQLIAHNISDSILKQVVKKGAGTKVSTEAIAHAMSEREVNA